MRRYVNLTVERVDEETADSRRVALSVPEDLQDTFRFVPGQHLPVQITVDGKPVRRTYSICSPPGRLPLEIGVRVQPDGQFSNFVADQLKPGDTLAVMPPFGRFHASAEPGDGRTCLMFAAGSGITPILSIMAAMLESEPATRIVLFYGNRRQGTTMFIDDLYALKNRFPSRLQLNFLFSQEQQEFPVFSGRLDADKVRELYRLFCSDIAPVEAFICGPDTMADVVSATLAELGMDPASIHTERFGAPRQRRAEQPAVIPEAGAGESQVTVIMDGHRRHFTMPRTGSSVVDAAAEHGIDLPYSCKGGVCATCRTLVRSGDVQMDSNYALEPWEVEKGFVLACQSHPTSRELVLDYDET